MKININKLKDLKEENIYSIKKEYIKFPIKNKRNFGIDLARIVSMIFIIGHHIIYHGGPLFQTEKFTFQHQTHIFLNVIFCSGVNVFGMISGFVGFHSHKYSNLLHLFLITLFYSILIACIFKYFNPKLINDIKNFLYPVFITDYWYFDCYFMMYFYLPLINKGIIGMELKEMKYFILILFLIFSCLGEIKNYTEIFASRDILKLNYGFSTYWLLILYFYGSYLGKFKVDKNNNKNYFYYLKYYILLFFSALIRTKIIINKMKRNNYNIAINVDYPAPSEVLISFSLIMIFSTYNINNKTLIKLIKFFAPLTYGVYLIHNHVLVRLNIINKYFLWLLKFQKSNIIFCFEFLCILGIFILCSLIDYIRAQFFKLFKIKILLDKFENTTKIIYDKYYLFINI